MSIASEFNLHQELAAFIRDQYEREDEMSVQKMVRLAYKRYASDDTFTEALAKEALRLLIPDIAADVRKNIRHEARNNTHDQTATERLASVFAYVGDGRSRSLLAMVKKEFIFAAEENEKHAKSTLCTAGLMRSCAALCKDDVTPLGLTLKEGEAEKLTDYWMNCESPPIPW